MITMSDIAAKANISRATVSLILNNRVDTGNVRISDATRDRVLKIAEQLGYCRNELARSVKLGYTNVIGVAGWMGDSFSGALLRGISLEAIRHGCSIKLFYAEADDDFGQLAKACVGQRPGGLILLNPLHHSNSQVFEKILTHAQIPLVAVDDSESEETLINEGQGLLAAIRHLQESGHEKIAFVSVEELGFGNARSEAFKKAMGSAGMNAGTADIFNVSSCPRMLPEDFTTLGRMFGQYTACIAASDHLAMKIYHAAQACNRVIPDDLSVIGFGDLVFSGVMYPPLTTIRQQFCAAGEQAAKLIFRKMTEKDLPMASVSLPVELIKRNSVKMIHGQKTR